jgi:hypothetical protein
MNKFSERYSFIMRNRYKAVYPRRGRTQRSAIFRAAARLLCDGFAGEEVPPDAVVGYLVDEGGYLFSQTLGTIRDVIRQEAMQHEDVCYYLDDEYMDVVHYVPQAMVDNERYPDVVDGGYYALITITR